MTPVTRQAAEETLADAQVFVAALESHLRSVGHFARAQRETGGQG
jgi:hypothetical protein